jgi:energy-coupling factor transport system ATP-binding protein
MSALIEIDNVSYDYSLPNGKKHRALDQISLAVQEGEYVAILGANGSGKTTLARHLNGLLLPSEGQIRVSGLDTRDMRTLNQVRALVGMVFQYPEDQIVATVVEEDVAFGMENLGLPPAEIRSGVESALRQVGMWEARQRPAYLLSAGQQQRVALAGVLGTRSRCIIFDEATAMLDPAGKRAVLEQIQRLNQAGITILTITHSMAEAAKAGRVVVLERGRLILDGPPASVFSQPARLRATGLDLPPAARLAESLNPLFPGLEGKYLEVDPLADAILADPRIRPGSAVMPSAAPSSTDGAEPLIEVMELRHTYLAGTPLAQEALCGVDLRVSANSIHGLLGATGSGKSTLLQHLNGLLSPQEGYVRIGPYSLNNPRLDVRAVRRMAGLVFQIPENQFFEQYVGDEISYGPRMLGTRAGLREDVRQAMEIVGLDFEAYKDRLTFTLSGGERRKVALASILAIQPEILLLDEPTAGLDPAARLELIANLKRLHGQGRTVVVSSHQMDDLAELSEDLTVLKDGKDQASGPAGLIFDQEDALHSWGLEPPEAARLAGLLRRRGLPIPAAIYREQDLVAALEGLLRMATP